MRYVVCMATAVLQVLGAAPALAKPSDPNANIHAYWLCSIAVKNTVTPPSALLYIGKVFEADTTEATYDAQAAAYGAEMMAYASAIGLQLKNQDPQLAKMPADPFCQGMTDLSEVYAKRNTLVTYSRPPMQLKIDEVDWIPTGTKAAPPEQN